MLFVVILLKTSFESTELFINSFNHEDNGGNVFAIDFSWKIGPASPQLQGHQDTHLNLLI